MAKGVRLAYDPRDGQEKPVPTLYREACQGLTNFIIAKATERLQYAEDAYTKKHNSKLAVEYAQEALSMFDEIPSSFPVDYEARANNVKREIEEKLNVYQVSSK